MTAKELLSSESRAPTRIEIFDVFHGLVFGAPGGGAHRLAVRPPGGAKRLVEIPAIGLARRRAQMIALEPGARPAGLGLEGAGRRGCRPDHADLGADDSKWDWRAWLDERMSGLSGAKGLIVDLRDNEGGIDCGDHLLARLASRRSPILPAERRVRYRRTPAHLDRYLDTWDKSFRALGATARPVGGGFLRLEDEPDGMIQPRGPRVVAAGRGPDRPGQQLGHLPLRPEGPAERPGPAFGPDHRRQPARDQRRRLFLRPPARERPRVRPPADRLFPPGTPPDAGLSPDVALAPSAADIAHGRDPAMAAAAAWILR